MNGERFYRQKSRYVFRPKEEWVGVPVPHSGIPAELVDAAREAVREHSVPSAAGRREWDLSGGILRCADCTTNMMTSSVAAARVKGRRFYYRYRKHSRDGKEACPHRRNHRANVVEPLVWEFVSGLLKDPTRLRAGLERLIVQERAAMRGGDPEKEAKAWLEQLSEVDQERRGYLRLAAKGRITDDELDEALAELEETREVAERELETLRSRRKVLEKLEQDRDALLESYARMVPEELDRLTAAERNHVYKMLRLRVLAYQDQTYEVSGVFGDCFALENQGEQA